MWKQVVITRANLDLVWTYAIKLLPAHDFALFERANYWTFESIVDRYVDFMFFSHRDPDVKRYNDSSKVSSFLLTSGSLRLSKFALYGLGELNGVSLRVVPLHSSNKNWG